MVVSGHPHTSVALPLGEEPSIPIEEEDGWAHIRSGHFGGQKVLSRVGIWTPDRPALNLVTVLPALSRIYSDSFQKQGRAQCRWNLLLVTATASTLLAECLLHNISFVN